MDVDDNDTPPVIKAIVADLTDGDNSSADQATLHATAMGTLTPEQQAVTKWMRQVQHNGDNECSLLLCTLGMPYAPIQMMEHLSFLGHPDAQDVLLDVLLRAIAADPPNARAILLSTTELSRALAPDAASVDPSFE